MAKIAKVTSTLREAHDVFNVWESMPSFKMGEVSLTDFNAVYGAAEELQKQYATKELELTGVKGNRDDKIRELGELITRFRSGMRSTYGPDSVQYEQSGGTRRSARKAPKRTADALTVPTTQAN